MSDTIVAGYSKLEEASRNTSKLKDSFLRLKDAVISEREVHADEKGEAADALEAQREGLLDNLSARTEKADQVIY
jgi:hypothetical protein